MFYEALIDADDNQEVIDIPEGNRDELAAAFLKKIEKALKQNEDKQEDAKESYFQIPDQPKAPHTSLLVPKSSLMQLANFQS